MAATAARPAAHVAHAAAPDAAAVTLGARRLCYGESTSADAAMPQQFASDNNAGMCPAGARGADARQRRGARAGLRRRTPGRSGPATRMRELFETDCAVFFVFNGTAANALALAQLCKPYDAVIAHALSHIEEDEAGAPRLLSPAAPRW